MQLTTSDIIALVSAAVAFVALVVATLTWLFPRQPARKSIPEFYDVVSEANASDLMKFLYDNDETIVKLRITVSWEDAFSDGSNSRDDGREIVHELTSNGGESTHTMTLRASSPEKVGAAGLEVSILPEKNITQSPMVFANGGYHLQGFFLVRHVPGMWQGYTACSLTQVSAEQMALRA